MKRFLKDNWLLVAAVVYVLLPIDIIPDWLLPIGFVDDLGVLLATLLWRYISYRKGDKNESLKENKENIVEGELVED